MYETTFRKEVLSDFVGERGSLMGAIQRRKVGSESPQKRLEDLDGNLALASLYSRTRTHTHTHTHTHARPYHTPRTTSIQANHHRHTQLRL